VNASISERMVHYDEFEENHFEVINKEEFDENFIENPSDDKQCEENDEEKMEAQNSKKEN
jgi:hypothetical protein